MGARLAVTQLLIAGSRMLTCVFSRRCGRSNWPENINRRYVLMHGAACRHKKRAAKGMSHNLCDINGTPVGRDIFIAQKQEGYMQIVFGEYVQWLLGAEPICLYT